MMRRTKLVGECIEILHAVLVWNELVKFVSDFMSLITEHNITFLLVLTVNICV